MTLEYLGRIVVDMRADDDSPAAAFGVMVRSAPFKARKFYDRVDSTRLAIYYANTRCIDGMSRERTMTSEAFFPKRDSIDLAGISGVKSAVFPLGSVEDENVIQAGNEYDMSLLVPMPDAEKPRETERAFVHLSH